MKVINPYTVPNTEEATTLRFVSQCLVHAVQTCKNDQSLARRFVELKAQYGELFTRAHRVVQATAYARKKGWTGDDAVRKAYDKMEAKYLWKDI
jgi:hypothetical protein